MAITTLYAEVDEAPETLFLVEAGTTLGPVQLGGRWIVGASFSLDVISATEAGRAFEFITTGETTVSGEAGVTVNAVDGLVFDAHAGGTVICVGTDEWTVVGGRAA